MINKETYEKLKKYQLHLRRGYKGGYVYGFLQKDFDELIKIYRELGGNARLKYTCNSCNLQLLKFLGKYFYEYEEWLKTTPVEQLNKTTIEAILEEKLPEDSTEEKEKPKDVKDVKKKRTRKKKEEDV